MRGNDQAYLEKKASELGVTASTVYGPINEDAVTITLMDGSKTYQFTISGLEEIQNSGRSMENLINCHIKEALGR